MMKLFTIGFTKTDMEGFFETLRESRPKGLIDVRINPDSQLSRFAHGKDLKYSLPQILSMGYNKQLRELLAPTKEMFSDYRKKKINWEKYEREFLKLMRERQIEKIPKEEIVDWCLLCSEHEPHNCHRRLVAEYLKKEWGDIEIIHLTPPPATPD